MQLNPLVIGPRLVADVRKLGQAAVSPPPSNASQAQLPAAVPGVFMRAWVPRPSTSCKGTMATSARERKTAST